MDHYYQQHKEELKEYYKKYYQRNKEYLLNYQKEVYKIKWYCPICEISIIKKFKKRHENTNRHIKNYNKKFDCVKRE